MVVRTQCNGSTAIGLRVGAANVRRYFPRGIDAVELRMGDLRIECALPPDFWTGQPEIHDPRLCEWLKFKTAHQSKNRKPIAMAMVQAGANAYTLQPLSLKRGSGMMPAA